MSYDGILNLSNQNLFQTAISYLFKSLQLVSSVKKDSEDIDKSTSTPSSAALKMDSNKLESTEQKDNDVNNEGDDIDDVSKSLSAANIGMKQQLHDHILLKLSYCNLCIGEWKGALSFGQELIRNTVDSNLRFVNNNL